MILKQYAGRAIQPALGPSVWQAFQHRPPFASSWTHLQHIFGHVTATATPSITFTTQNTAVGSVFVLVAMTSNAGATFSAMHDSSGNAWIALGGFNDTTNGDTYGAWACVNATGGVKQTATVTVSVSGATDMYLWEFSGAAAFAQDGAAAGTNSAARPIVLPAFTAGVGALWFNAGGGFATISFNAPWTGFTNSFGNGCAYYAPPPGAATPNMNDSGAGTSSSFVTGIALAVPAPMLVPSAVGVALASAALTAPAVLAPAATAVAASSSALKAPALLTPSATAVASASATVTVPTLAALTSAATAQAQATAAVTAATRFVSTATAVAAAAATVTLPNTVYRDLILSESGLVSYWRLGEASGNALDSKGSNPGTTIASGITRNVAGLIVNSTEGAASGDGTANDSITIPSSSSLDVGAQITVELWVRPSTIPATLNPNVINRGTDHPFYIRHYQSGDARWEFNVYDAGNNRNSQAVTSPVAQVGVRQYLAMTYDGTRFMAYINGVNVANLAAVTPGSAVLAGGSLILFNRSPGDATDGFIGTMDEVALYNVALTPAQIANHYATGLAVALAPKATVVAGAACALTAPVQLFTAPPPLSVLALEGGGGVANGNTFSETPAANSVLLIWLAYTTTGGVTASVTGRGLPWTQQKVVPVGPSTTLECWTAPVRGSPGSGSIQIVLSAVTNFAYDFEQIVGADLVTPLVSSNIVNASGSGTASSVAFSALASPNDFFLYANAIDITQNQTPASLWTEQADQPKTNVSLETQRSPSSPGLTASSTWSTVANWGAIGVELNDAVMPSLPVIRAAASAMMTVPDFLFALGTIDSGAIAVTVGSSAGQFVAGAVDPSTPGVTAAALTPTWAVSV